MRSCSGSEAFYMKPEYRSPVVNEGLPDRNINEKTERIKAPITGADRLRQVLNNAYNSSYYLLKDFSNKLVDESRAIYQAIDRDVKKLWDKLNYFSSTEKRERPFTGVNLIEDLKGGLQGLTGYIYNHYLDRYSGNKSKKDKGENSAQVSKVVDILKKYFHSFYNPNEKRETRYSSRSLYQNRFRNLRLAPANSGLEEKLKKAA